MMRPVGAAVVLGLLVGAWAQVPPSVFPPVSRPFCDSENVEEAAFVAQDYINAQHTYGYKYVINRIEGVKITAFGWRQPLGGELYKLDLELLETKCYVLDPTPAANCTVRPKHEPSVKIDCDAIVRKVGGKLSVLAFKCKPKPECPDCIMPCGGCISLLPLNHTEGLEVVQSSLAIFNNKSDDDATFALLEVGRLSSQAVALAPKYYVEYAIVETKCAGDACTPLNRPVARQGFCTATAAGVPREFTVDCDIFAAVALPADGAVNGTTVPKPPSSRGQYYGHKHHKPIRLHDPSSSGLLSESKESAEEKAKEPPKPKGTAVPLPLAPGIQLCPGRIRHF